MMKRAQFVFVLAAFCGAGLIARLGWTQQAEFPAFVSPGADAPDSLPAPRLTSGDVLPVPAVAPASPSAAIRSRPGFQYETKQPRSRTPAVPPTPAVPGVATTPPTEGVFEDSEDLAGLGPGVAPTPPTQIVRPRRVTKLVPRVSFQMEEVSPEEVEADNNLRNAMETLKSGKDEESRNQAKEVIHEALGKQFDHDFARREQELADLEQRVTMLRRQLEKRKAAKDSIVELRLQTLVNESEGLGFPEAGVPELINAYSPIPVDPDAPGQTATFATQPATIRRPSATPNPFRPSGMIPGPESAPGKFFDPGDDL